MLDTSVTKYKEIYLLPDDLIKFSKFAEFNIIDSTLKFTHIYTDINQK